MKALLVITAVLLLSSCGYEEKLERGPIPGALDIDTLTSDGAVVGGRLPPGSINRNYIGNGWFTFELNGERFLYGDKGRASVLTKINPIAGNDAPSD